MAQIVYQESAPLYYPERFLARLVHALLGIIETILALRLILTLLGASTSAPFIAWFYSLSEGFVVPFRGAFPLFSLGPFTVDLSIIFAMIGYGILAWLLLRIIGFFSYLR